MRFSGGMTAMVFADMDDGTVIFFVSGKFQWTDADTSVTDIVVVVIDDIISGVMVVKRYKLFHL